MKFIEAGWSYKPNDGSENKTYTDTAELSLYPREALGVYAVFAAAEGERNSSVKLLGDEIQSTSSTDNVELHGQLARQVLFCIAAVAADQLTSPYDSRVRLEQRTATIALAQGLMSELEQIEHLPDEPTPRLPQELYWEAVFEEYNRRRARTTGSRDSEDGFSDLLATGELVLVGKGE